MPPSPLLATGSKVKTSIVASMPRAALTNELSCIKAATEVKGVIALKSLWPVILCEISKLSNKVCESKSVPPREIKLPSAYLMVNLPSLSEIVEFSVASATKFSFTSIKTFALEI